MDKESKASSTSFKITQTSYNYVQNLSKTYVLTLKREGEILVLSNFVLLFSQTSIKTLNIFSNQLQAPEKCAILWNDIRKKDLTTGGTPSIKMMEEIFEKDFEIVKNL